MNDFSGVKIALFFGSKLVMFLRDNKPGLRFANLWDFPGGGREEEETPFACVQREVEEEFGITLRPESIVWQKEYPAMHDAHLRAFFMVAMITEDEVARISFGEEGQRWQLMEMDEFFAREDVVPHLKGRLQDYLERAA